MIEHNDAAAGMRGLTHRPQGMLRFRQPLEHTRSRHDVERAAAWQVIDIGHRKLRVGDVLTCLLNQAGIAIHPGDEALGCDLFRDMLRDGPSTDTRGEGNYVS